MACLVTSKRLLVVPATMIYDIVGSRPNDELSLFLLLLVAKFD